jgi:hypothetical protein
VKIHPVGAKLFRMDRQLDAWTDRHDEANSFFLAIFQDA